MEITGEVKSSSETIVGATVFKSDALGKPVSNVATTTDVNGKYTLKPINSGDYVTARIVGKNPLTQLVSGTTLNFNLQDSASTEIKPFEVVAEKPKVSSPIRKPKDGRVIISIVIGVVALAATGFIVARIVKG
jgi:hypothetical protein